jgi:hypothetical protein
MKKRSKQCKIDCVVLQNPVAKFAHHFNKCHIIDAKNKYQRKAKHAKKEILPIVPVMGLIGKVSFFNSLVRYVGEEKMRLVKVNQFANYCG